MVQPSITPDASKATFSGGSFTYTVGDASPVVEFGEQGEVTVTLDGEVIVTGAYKVIGDLLEIVDEGGPYAFPESGPGTYKWSLNGKTLSFSLIEDNNIARKKGFAQPFIMQG